MILFTFLVLKYILVFFVDGIKERIPDWYKDYMFFSAFCSVPISVLMYFVVGDLTLLTYYSVYVILITFFATITYIFLCALEKVLNRKS